MGVGFYKFWRRALEITLWKAKQRDTLSKTNSSLEGFIIVVKIAGYGEVCLT